MSNKTLCSSIFGLVVVVGGFFWYMNNPRTMDDMSSIKIGFIAPLTGDAASIGTPEKSAVELAISEINATGGINGRQLEAIYEDGQCAATPAASAATKLITLDKVVAIVGGICSTETAAFAPRAMQSKVVVISPCSSAPSLSKTGTYFFRDYPSDSFQGKFAAEYAYNTLGARKVAILYHQSDWGDGIKDVFKTRFTELGGQIVAEEGAPQTSRDYRTALSKIKASHPDYIYAPTYPEGGTIVLKQARDMGISTKFLGGDAWSDTKFQKDVSDLGLNILYTESKSETSDDFKTKLLAKTGGDSVPLCSAQGYDAVYLFANAAKKVGVAPDALAGAIRATKYDGVSGHIEFDQNGDVTSAQYHVKKIENGTATVVSE